MAEDPVRNTTYELKATIYALGVSQLKWVRERVADLQYVKVEEAAVAARASMGFTPWEQLRWMLGALVFFHSSEFLLALAYHGRRRVNAASTLISGPYLVALAFSMVEHALESRFAPGLKKHAFVSYTGLAMVVLGEGLRKLAVVTANKSFTHDIKVDKRQEHKLITYGIYRFFRHPSYLGFFIWSIGTQVLLVNPVCTVGYTIVTWRFFDHRIPYEEYFLRRFFWTRLCGIYEQSSIGDALHQVTSELICQPDLILVPMNFSAWVPWLGTSIKMVWELIQQMEETMRRWDVFGSPYNGRCWNCTGCPYKSHGHSTTRYPNKPEHGFKCSLLYNPG